MNCGDIEENPGVLATKKIEWKAFVDAVGIKGADLKNESLLQIFAAVCGTLM